MGKQTITKERHFHPGLKKNKKNYALVTADMESTYRGLRGFIELEYRALCMLGVVLQ